jgi:3-oxoadipate enol-lactonase
MSAVDVSHRVDGPEDAPVVLLSNSLGATYAMWDPQMPALSARFRVVRYDSRGHGRSPVPVGPYSIDDLVDDVVALLDRLGVERAHVVGLSLGGMTALRLAAREPHRVDRLAVLCTSALLGPPEGWVERAQLVRSEGTGSVAGTIVQRWLTTAHQAADPEYTAELAAMIAATPAEGYASSCTAIEHLDLRADLASIAAPTLAIAGAEDPVTPPPHLEAIVAGIAGSRLTVVEQAAHMVNLDQPGAVTAALLTHLTGSSTSPAED